MNKKPKIPGIQNQGFWSSLLISFIDGLVKFLIAFTIGTAAGGIVCWYYSIPLIFSLLGGILVLGLALALYSDSSLF